MAASCLAGPAVVAELLELVAPELLELAALELLLELDELLELAALELLLELELELLLLLDEPLLALDVLLPDDDEDEPGLVPPQAATARKVADNRRLCSAVRGMSMGRNPASLDVLP